MAVVARVESVTNAAEVLVTPGHEATAQSPLKVTVANRHATVSVWLGGPTVDATAAGFEVKPGEAFDIDLAQGDILYGFASAANNAVHIIQRTR